MSSGVRTFALKMPNRGRGRFRGNDHKLHHHRQSVTSACGHQQTSPDLHCAKQLAPQDGYCALLSCVALFYAAQYYAVLCYTMSRHAMSSHALPCSALPGVVCQDVPYKSIVLVSCTVRKWHVRMCYIRALCWCLDFSCKYRLSCMCCSKC